MKYLFIAVVAITPTCAVSQVSGSGTAGQVAKWTGTTAIGNSLMFDNGSGIGIGGNALNLGFQQQLSVINNTGTSGGYALIGLQNTDSTGGMELEFWNANTGTAHSAAGLSGSGLMYLNNGASNASDVWFGTLGGDYTFWKDGNVGVAKDLAILGSGGLNIAATTSLGSSSSGFGNFWFDSSNLTLQANNSSGALSTMVFPNACTGGTPVVTGINSNGTVTCGSGGGAGGSGNFPTVAVASNVMTMFSNCISAPCMVGTGGIGYSPINSTATANAPASPASNTAYVYWDGACKIMAPDSISASGCTYVPGSAFPYRVYPIAVVGYAGGDWNSATNIQPATNAVENVLAGPGLTVSADNGVTQAIGIDTTAASLGTGTANYVARWNGNSYTLGTGLLQDDGVNGVSIGGPINTNDQLTIIHNTVNGSASLGIHDNDPTGHVEVHLYDSGSNYVAFGLDTSSKAAYIYNTISSTSPGAGWAIGGESGDVNFEQNGTFNAMFTVFTSGGGNGIRILPKTFSSLPSCSSVNEGQMIPISDSNTNTFDGPITASGSYHEIAYCNGTQWVAH